MFSQKTATAPISAGLLAYPVFVILKSFSPSCRHWLEENELSLLSITPVTMERWEDNRDSREVTQESSTYWISGENEVLLEETSRRIGQPVMHKGK